MSPNRIVVFMVSENHLLRESLIRVLRKKDDFVIESTSANSPSLLEEISAAHPDVVLFDSAKVALSGHRVISRMREAGQYGKVMMIGMEKDEATFLRAVAEGVLGYVLEDASSSENVRAIRAVVTGEAVCPPQYSALLFQCAARELALSYNPSPKERFGLSQKEEQLIRLIRIGLSNKEIGSSLNLSEQTVKNNIHHIMRKVGARDRMDIVARCYSEGPTAAGPNLPRPRSSGGSN